MGLTVALIGLGKMGCGLVKGFNTPENGVQLRGVIRRPESCAAMEEELGIPVSSNLEASMKGVDVVVLCMQPANVSEACGHLVSLASLSPSTIVVSVAAGVSTVSLETYLGSLSNQVVRAMPNTLCAVQQGMTLLCAGTRSNETCIETVRLLFNLVGKAVILDERNIDAGTALSASGPAFAYTFMEAMAQAGVKLGLSSKAALEMIAQCLIGSGTMVQRSGLHPALLRDEVTTPGGCTIAGVLALEDRAFRSVVSNAVITAANTAGKLASSLIDIASTPSRCPALATLSGVSRSSLLVSKNVERTGSCSCLKKNT